jgi:hypothetical protein
MTLIKTTGATYYNILSNTGYTVTESFQTPKY